MATRSTIIVEGFDKVMVYKHWDGYPEAMTAWLMDFNQRFKAARGTESHVGNYKFAQLLRSSVIDGKKFNLDGETPSKYTGWGVYPINTPMNQEYEYTLHLDGDVSYIDIDKGIQVFAGYEEEAVNA